MTYLNYVWRILTKNQKKRSLILFFLILVSTFLEVLGIGLIVPVILFFIEDDIVTKYPFLNSIVGYFFYEPSKTDYIKFGLISLLFIYFLKNSFLTFFAYYESRFAHKIEEQISNRLFKYYIFEDIEFHNKTNSSFLINNLTREVQIFTNSLTHLIVLITEIFVFSGIAILLLYYEPKGFLIVSTISFLVIGIYNIFTIKRLMKLGETRHVTNKILIQKVQQGLAGLREIKIYNRENGLLNTFKKSTSIMYNTLWASELIRKAPKLLLEFASVLSLAVIVLILTNFGIETNDVIAILGLFGLAAVRILPSLNRMFHAFQRIKFGFPATRILSRELTKFENNRKIENYNSHNKPARNLEFNSSIKVENLSFSYLKNEIKIFDKINFEIKKKQSVGIKGSSGSGKSTLVDIILGLLKPAEGAVLVDNRDIFENLLSWQQKASYVPQNVFLTDDKLSRNIALGIDDEKINKQKLEEAILAAELNEFVSSLTEGSDTVVGERGSKLSGGQIQRIGIARALYNNPEVLVLDETTNSLDKKTEAKIIETIFKIQKNRTVIIISHEEKLLKECDLVFSIKNKKIIRD